LGQLHDVYDKIKEQNAEIIAVSPNTQEWAEKTVEERGYEFPVCTDYGLKVAEQYNLKFELPKDTQEDLREAIGSDLSKYNEVEGWHLPVPSTYVLDRDRTILWAYSNMDYTDRPDGERVLQVIKELK
jgi:peroxiredoxin